MFCRTVVITCDICGVFYNSGALKPAALERALSQIGARKSGTLTMAQFSTLLDSIQEKIELSHLDSALQEEGDVEDSAHSTPKAVKSSPSKCVPRVKPTPALKTRRGAAAVTSAFGADESDSHNEGSDYAGSWDDIDAEEDEDCDYEGSEGEDGTEVSEELAAQEVYDELRGNRASVTVADFLRWQDVQDLLESGALTKDQLADTMDSCEVNIGKGDRTQLPFEKVLRC
jgi:hypothetical protein